MRELSKKSEKVFRAETTPRRQPHALRRPTRLGVPPTRLGVLTYDWLSKQRLASLSHAQVSIAHQPSSHTQRPGARHQRPAWGVLPSSASSSIMALSTATYKRLLPSQLEQATPSVWHQRLAWGLILKSESSPTQDTPRHQGQCLGMGSSTQVPVLLFCTPKRQLQRPGVGFCCNLQKL
ncbi:hypothetical protein PIB30_042719 [Stylosanthes scabra]|uniref:Uncharacterized protein n=1 Tax=Stylosanthes scabra TaxID=79078 RepID=A0ABU6ZE33_9FABA|nr:hypothetical protein [Stylosanthes scabra]